MFKKIRSVAIFLMISGPFLIALTVGYPLQKQLHPDGSRRCFKVGELGQFVRCFGTGNRLFGSALIKQLYGDLSAFSPLFVFLLPILLTIMAIASAHIALEGIPVKKEKLQYPVDKKKR